MWLEEIGLPPQNMMTILGSIVNINKEDLHFDNELQKEWEKLLQPRHGFSNLHILIDCFIFQQKWASQKSNHLRPIYHKQTSNYGKPKNAWEPIGSGLSNWELKLSTFLSNLMVVA